MAEGLLRARMDGSSKIVVKSAGIAASNGSPANIETRNILLNYSVDFSSFRSQQLTKDLLEEADYVFCMSRMHREAILSQRPEFRERVLLLGEFLGQKEPQDVFDPFGLGADAYKKVETQVLIALDNILSFIEENSSLQNDLNADS